MVGGLLWGCSLFLFGFFPRFLRFFFGKDVRFPWSSRLFGLTYLTSCCGQSVDNFPDLDYNYVGTTLTTLVLAVPVSLNVVRRDYFVLVVLAYENGARLLWQ